jgi:AcrR family transcriptional regulator
MPGGMNSPNSTTEVERPAKPRPRGRRPRQPSAEQLRRNAETRLKIVHAAGLVVGRHGYAGCSISRITAEAGVSHGAFYLHFKSQQDLFDVLLPELGTEMVASIAKAVRGAPTIEEMERRGITANIAYLVENPHIYRVMSEATLHAPSAFKLHHDLLVQGYQRSLRRLLGARAQDDRQLEAFASILMGARSFLFMRFAVDGPTIRHLDPDLIETYVQFVLAGLDRLVERGAADPAREGDA